MSQSIDKKRSAAQQLFAVTGWTVEGRMASIEANAAALLDRPQLDADEKRLAIRYLQFCCRTLYEPAPGSLLRLIERIVDVPEVPRSRIRNRVKWSDAARYYAANPAATPRQIATAIGYDQFATIKRWMYDPAWLDEVAMIAGMAVT